MQRRIRNWYVTGGHIIMSIPNVVWYLGLTERSIHMTNTKTGHLLFKRSLCCLDVCFRPS